MTTSDTSAKTAFLLPTGITDILYPQADIDTRTLNTLLHTAFTFGFEQISPPLVEFTDTVSTTNAFHVMDPVSNRMMAIRSDMTPQINRIVNARLHHKKRPIRVMYGGNVLRVQSSQTRPSREYTQFGAELIGVDTIHADMEIIHLAIATLQAVNVDKINIDLCIPKLAYAYAQQMHIDTADLDTVLSSRNIQDLSKYDTNVQDVFKVLITPKPTISETLSAILELPTCPAMHPVLQRLKMIVETLPNIKGVRFTLDPCENRGFSFHDGVAFTIFCADSQAPLGRGGKYTLDTSNAPAVGFSLYFDSLQKVVKIPQDTRRIYAPVDTPMDAIQQNRKQGHVIVMGLCDDTDIDMHTDALNNKCTHILINGEIETL